MRLIHGIYNRLHDLRYKHKTLNVYRRLSDLIFHLLTFLFAIASLLMVFNLLNDWLLLGITLLSGFWVEFRFRIDYWHQQRATGVIPQ